MTDDTAPTRATAPVDTVTSLGTKMQDSFDNFEAGLDEAGDLQEQLVVQLKQAAEDLDKAMKRLNAAMAGRALDGRDQ